MYISNSSFKNFVGVNGFLIFLGALQYQYIQRFTNNHNVTDFLYVYIAFILRNYLLLLFIHIGTQNKPTISNNPVNVPIESYKYEFHYYVMSTTAVETVTHVLIKPTILVSSYSLPVEIIRFIPISFCFEVVFDFFHYWSHRFIHSKQLYKYIHKTHHKFDHPTAIIAFYQDPIDLVVTNSIPTVLTLSIIPRISYLQFMLIVTYKIFIEISGHIGKKMHPTSCFSQCIWLPRMLGIELYTEDHDLHHSANTCNYAKRFSLYDKLFGTYKSSH